MRIKKILSLVASVFVFFFHTSLFADDIQKSAYWGLNYYNYEEQNGGHDPFMQERTKFLPSLLLGYRDFNGINSKDSRGFSYFIEGTIGQVEYSQYTGVGTHTHNYWKVQTEGYYPIVFNFYLGLGYRHLYDYLSDYGTGGYDRRNEMWYLPIGHVLNLKDNSNFRFQFNYLIQGTQTSYLSNVYGAGTDLENKQNKGYGLDLSYIPSSNNSEWFIRYWDIGDSTTNTVSNSSYTVTGMEPKNQTLEIGFKSSF